MESLKLLLAVLVTVTGSFVAATEPEFPGFPLIPYTCDKHPEVCIVEGGVKQQCCKNACVNVKTDLLNCGKCGHKCKDGEHCCQGRCFSLMRDRSNCGMCGNVCGLKEKCCYGKCVREKTDPLNCGKCGHMCEFAEGCCQGKCENLQSNKEHCAPPSSALPRLLPQPYQFPFPAPQQQLYPSPYSGNNRNNRNNQRNNRNLYSNSGGCQICHKTNHLAYSCYHRQNLSYRPMGNSGGNFGNYRGTNGSNGYGSGNFPQSNTGNFPGYASNVSQGNGYVDSLDMDLPLLDFLVMVLHLLVMETLS
ncbi:hypothetical protein Vadar_008248 [Vaccinium darrowii]|uniref:Uncharacterized protein n=1 Tax=Vaccinium darrowii TaxID=229202 RepID=A0ACB7X8T1_9ERIC|nr:hypothetical protein Vadar_008248 [Vaccinium darrowii]